MKSSDAGTVMKKTLTSGGDSRTIIRKDPVTVMTLVQIISRSVDSDALTVSMS